MFDIDSGKLLIVAVLALIVIGPKELPRVMRQVGQAIGKMRRMASEFQGQFMDAMKEADIADIRKELDELNKSAALDVHFDPARDLQNELTGAMSATSSQVAAAAEVEPIAVPQGPVMDDTSSSPASLTEDSASAVTQLSDTSGPAVSASVVPTKRKIVVKRRRSAFHVVADDPGAAAPSAVRRKVVRAKPVDLSEMQPS